MATYQKFELPDAGEGLTEADIVEWRVAVGDTVAVNEVIVEIETAKSLVELPSPFAGVVTEILVSAGQTANVGDPIIVIDTDPNSDSTSSDDSGSVQGDPAAASDEPDNSGSVLVGYGTGGEEAAPRRRRQQPTVAATATEPTRPATTEVSPASRAAVSVPAHQRSGRPANAHVLAKPPVRLLARELGIDLASVAASGPGGIITREDVLQHQRQAQARELATYPGDDQPWLADGEVSPDGRQTRVPVRSVRKRTAEAMVTSAFTAPHVSVFHTVDVTQTMRLVAQLKADREFSGVRVTPLLIAMKALLLAVNRHPEINASWDEATQQIAYKHYVNLGIAAATPRGLVVPNIKDAHRMGMLELAQALGDLTSTARAGKTRPQDMSDGTITITNVGVFGIDTGTPILNPGEAAILAFGAIREQPWVHQGEITIRHVTQLALSFDHRLVDGELGARVLADIAAVLEEPGRGLVWG